MIKILEISPFEFSTVASLAAGSPSISLSFVMYYENNTRVLPV